MSSSLVQGDERGDGRLMRASARRPFTAPCTLLLRGAIHACANRKPVSSFNLT
jgi:hypothetical protein